MNKDQIKKVLPHREPFLFLDKIIEISSEEIIAEKTFPKDESFYEGHFPNIPVTPGVIILEAMAQATALLDFKSNNRDRENLLYYFVGIDKARFSTTRGS